jgi:hypothetical protein
MLRRIFLSHFMRSCHSVARTRAVNMHILKSLLIAVVLIKSASLQQQQLSCIHCTDCYNTDRSFWNQRACDDDSPPGVQTTPGIPIIPQYSTQNETTLEVNLLAQQTNSHFQCFTITQDREYRRFDII